MHYVKIAVYSEPAEAERALRVVTLRLWAAETLVKHLF